ncbi:MAG: hypothetical protein HPY44_00900 [Armatimonadetes bacterium]|nr:hypothetical protein [Armatimonadota bacterium]
MENVLEYVRVLAVPGLGALLLGLAFRVSRKYVEKINDERLRALLLELVKAAEQIYGSGNGEVKMRYVQEQATRRGVRVDRNSVEAAVYDLATGKQG